MKWNVKQHFVQLRYCQKLASFQVTSIETSLYLHVSHYAFEREIYDRPQTNKFQAWTNASNTVEALPAGA